MFLFSKNIQNFKIEKLIYLIANLKSKQWHFEDKQNLKMWATVSQYLHCTPIECHTGGKFRALYQKAIIVSLFYKIRIGQTISRCKWT